MHLNDFDYVLPPDLIAQSPATPRDSSRLLVYNRADRKKSTAHFYNILDYLKKGDVIVINTTRVMRARLHINGKEVLLIKKLSDLTYEVIGKGIRDTKVMTFTPEQLATAEVPLPHYITGKDYNPDQYQTVYNDKEGSCAAPTAGLHWTPELMDKARKKGVIFCEIVLHVGLGTFRPVKCDDITQHQMHSEYYEISPHAAQIINEAKRDGRRVIATGTTSVRTLETVATQFGEIRACSGDTNIFIYPPYKFRIIDGMITNFHLPKSTLLMLVSAFVGREVALDLYNFAIADKFRFFSFGDACLLL